MSNALSTAAPQPRRSLWRFIVDRNPFFLLSALCMFAGVRVILSALDAAPGRLPPLLWSIAALHAYELLVIGLGLFLIVRRGQYRDGWMLLSIEALFLLDLTNLNAELFTAHFRAGIYINLLSWLLAVVKITIVCRTLKLRWTGPEFAYVALQLAGIFMMAGLFKQIARHAVHEGSLSVLTLYGAWWIAGGMLVLATVLLRRPSDRPIGSPMAALPGRLYLFLPFVSLLVHLCGANRVYALHFHPANVAPVLLGVAVLLTRWRGDYGRSFLLGSQAMLAGMAVLISTTVPPELLVQFGSHTFSPLRLSLAGSAGVLAIGFVHSWQILAAQMAAVALMAAAMGNSPAAMQQNAWGMVKAILALLKRLIPETQMQWGIVAVVSSFVMLGLGAIVSLRRQAPRGAVMVSEEAPLAE